MSDTRYKFINRYSNVEYTSLTFKGSNVGIGTSNPGNYVLDVAGSINVGSLYISGQQYAAGAVWGVTPPNFQIYYTGRNVGIGVEDPGNILQVGAGGRLRISNGPTDYTTIGTIM
jgi:hypothetical protein